MNLSATKTAWITQLLQKFTGTQTTDMTTETETASKITTSDKIAVKANGKVWLAGGKTHAPDDNDMVYLTPEELRSAQIFAWDSATYGVLKEQRSFFGGRLVRWSENNWCWIDGTKEERVFSRTLDLNYPELYKDAHREEVEVPEALAKAHGDLTWATEGNYPLRQAYDDPNRWNFDQAPGPFGRVYLPRRRVAKSLRSSAFDMEFSQHGMSRPNMEGQ